MRTAATHDCLDCVHSHGQLLLLAGFVPARSTNSAKWSWCCPFKTVLAWKRPSRMCLFDHPRGCGKTRPLAIGKRCLVGFGGSRGAGTWCVPAGRVWWQKGPDEMRLSQASLRTFVGSVRARKSVAALVWLDRKSRVLPPSVLPCASCNQIISRSEAECLASLMETSNRFIGLSSERSLIKLWHSATLIVSGRKPARMPRGCGSSPPLASTCRPE